MNPKINDILFMVVELVTIMERSYDIYKYYRDGIDTKYKYKGLHISNSLMLPKGYGVENVMLANTVSAVGDVVPFKSLVARIEMPSKNR